MAEGQRRGHTKSQLLKDFRDKTASARGRTTKKHHAWLVSQMTFGKGADKEMATLIILNSTVDFISGDAIPPWNGTEEEKKAYYLHWHPLVEAEILKEIGDMDRAMWLGIHRKDKNFKGNEEKEKEKDKENEKS